jgi:hypothetical protein
LSAPQVEETPMTAVDAKQHQATWQDGSPAGTEFGAAGSQLKPGASRLHLPPKVPAGVSVAGGTPQEPQPEMGPLHLPSGTEQPVSSHMLQLNAQAGPIGNSAAGAGLHNTLYAGQTQPSTGKAVATASAGTPSAEAVALRIDKALKKSDYLKALDEAYASAMPDEQRLMRADPNFQLVIVDTAKTATRALTDSTAAPLLARRRRHAPMPRSITSIECCSALIRHLQGWWRMRPCPPSSISIKLIGICPTAPGSARQASPRWYGLQTGLQARLKETMPSRVSSL